MAINRRQTDHVALNQFQDEVIAETEEIGRQVQEIVAEVANKVITRGRLVEAVLATGANTVAHGLQRVAGGWLLAYKSANVTLFDTQAPDGLSVYITASGAATVKIWVFG